MYDHFCFEICPPLTNTNLELKRCVTPCPNKSNSCSVCDIDTCLVCNDSRNYLIAGVCLDSCPPASTKNDANMSCLCDPTCEKCGWKNYSSLNNVSILKSQEAQCLACYNTSLKPYKNMCVEVCPSDSVLDLDSGFCIYPSECDFSKSYLYISSKENVENVCYTNCPRNLIYLKRYCVESCFDQYFKKILYNFTLIPSNLTEYYCENCFLGCKSCLNESSNTCFDCMPNYVFLQEENQCYPNSCPSNLGYIVNTNNSKNCTMCRTNCSHCHSSLYFYENNCLISCPANCVIKFDNIQNQSYCQFVEKMYYISIKHNAIVLNESFNVNHSIIFFVSTNIPNSNEFDLQLNWTLETGFNNQQLSIINSFNSNYKKRSDRLIIPPNVLDLNSSYRINVSCQFNNSVLEDFFIFSTVNIRKGELKISLGQLILPYSLSSVTVNGWHCDIDPFNITILVSVEKSKEISENIDAVYLKNNEVIDGFNGQFNFSIPNCTNCNLIFVKIHNYLFEYYQSTEIVISGLELAKFFFSVNLTPIYLYIKSKLLKKSEILFYRDNQTSIDDRYYNLLNEIKYSYLLVLTNDTFVMSTSYNPPLIDMNYYALDYIGDMIYFGFSKCFNDIDCLKNGRCYFNAFGKKQCNCSSNFVGSMCQIDKIGFQAFSQKISDSNVLLNEIFDLSQKDNRSIPFFIQTIGSLIKMRNLLDQKILVSLIAKLEYIFELFKSDKMQLSLMLPVLSNIFYHFENLNFMLFLKIKKLIMKSIDAYSRKILSSVLTNSVNVFYSTPFLNVSILQLPTSNLTSHFSTNDSSQNFFISDQTATIIIGKTNLILFSSLVWKYLPQYFTVNNNIISVIIYFNFFDVILNEWVSFENSELQNSPFVIKIPILASFDHLNETLYTTFNIKSENIFNNGSKLWVCQYWNYFEEEWQSQDCYLQKFHQNNFYCACSNMIFKEYSVSLNLQAYPRNNDTYQYKIAHSFQNYGLRVILVYYLLLFLLLSIMGQDKKMDSNVQLSCTVNHSKNQRENIQKSLIMQISQFILNQDEEEKSKSSQEINSSDNEEEFHLKLPGFDHIHKEKSKLSSQDSKDKDFEVIEDDERFDHYKKIEDFQAFDQHVPHQKGEIFSPDDTLKKVSKIKKNKSMFPEELEKQASFREIGMTGSDRNSLKKSKKKILNKKMTSDEKKKNCKISFLKKTNKFLVCNLIYSYIHRRHYL